MGRIFLRVSEKSRNPFGDVRFPEEVGGEVTVQPAISLAAVAETLIFGSVLRLG
jgi:hypothetical protein